MNLIKLKVNIVFFVKNITGFLTQKKEKVVAKMLLKNSLVISTAESCTGGLISSRLTDLSGSSAYINQNFVTYANSAKVKLLGVNPDTIEKYGVVSSEVAVEMALGLLKNYDCNIAISTTGIAGPTGATKNKPLGLVFMAIADDKTHKSYKFEANPLLIRRFMKYAFCDKALDNLIDFLNENKK